MAATAIWDVTDRLDRVLSYAANPVKTENLTCSSPDFQGLPKVLRYITQDGKTEKQFYVTGINCDPAIAYRQMSQTKLQFQKTDGILAFHGYQSFAPGEADTETAHTIGVKLAQELWGGGFEVVVSTHLDKQHLHNHFVLNSVSFLDGKRYYDNKNTYARMRQASDRLCQEYALSIIHHPQKGEAKHYAEWKAEKEGKPTWRGLVRKDVDEAISSSMTFSQFIAALRRQGYEVKTGVKYMAVRPPGKERFVRLKTLGDNYTEEAVKQRILQKARPQRLYSSQHPPFRRKHCIVRSGASLKTKRKLTGLQALYFHYLYKMGILPKRRASGKRAHFLLREDIRRLDEITAQTKMLCTCRIENKEQLRAYRSGLEQEIAGLAGARKSFYNRLRRCQSDERAAEYKQEIAGLTKKISLLRKEVKLCAGILSRSEDMMKKLLQVRKEEERPEHRQREEEKTYEQRRRRCGPNGQHEP